MKKIKRKFKFISETRDGYQVKDLSLIDVANFNVSSKYNPDYYKEIKKLRLPNRFVLALCGGKWPKTKHGACYEGVACWKIDTDRRTLVPLDSSFGDDSQHECPVPDLQMKLVVDEFQ